MALADTRPHVVHREPQPEAPVARRSRWSSTRWCTARRRRSARCSSERRRADRRRETSNRVLMTPIPPQVRVTLRGPRSTLDDLHADDIGNVQLDLRGGNETRRARSTRRPVPVPPGLQRRADRPAGARPARGRTSSCATCPSRSGVVGTPAPGFVVKGAPTADPATVRAHGPKSEVMVLQRARADAFDVTGLTEGKYTRQLAIDRPGGRVTFDVASVSATVRDRPRGGRATLHEGPGRGHRPREREGAARRGRRAPHVPARDRPRPAPRADRPARRRSSTSTEHGCETRCRCSSTIDQCDVHVTPPTVIVRW